MLFVAFYGFVAGVLFMKFLHACTPEFAADVDAQESVYDQGYNDGYNDANAAINPPLNILEDGY